jgi:hypothetical protein
LVAAITRTSMRWVLVPPSGRISCSCSTRRSFACSGSASSPISSRKIEPVSASANRPRRSVRASVNAPRLCPNSSLSIKVSGTAARLTATNGALVRGEL